MSNMTLISPDRMALFTVIKLLASTVVVCGILLPFVLLTVQKWKPAMEYIINDNFDGCYDDTCFHDGIEKAVWGLEVSGCFTDKYENIHVVPGQLVLSSTWNGGNKNNCARLVSRELLEQRGSIVIEARIKMNVTNAICDFRLESHACTIHILKGGVWSCSGEDEAYDKIVDAREWHVYKLKWTGDIISWYIDDMLDKKYEIGQGFASPYRIVFDIVHNDSQQGIDDIMYIDWVRVYSAV